MSSQPQFDQTSVVKEKAREIIGQPRPTTVRHHRKGGKGGSRKVESLGAWYVPPKALTHKAGAEGFLDLENLQPEEQPFILGAPTLAENPMKRGTAASVPVIPRQPRERHKPAMLFRFSPDAIQHANYLLATQGHAAMEKYLADLKNKREDNEENTMSSITHASLAEDLARKQEQKQTIVPGDLQQIILTYRERARHHRAEAMRNSAEAEKLEKAAAKFDEAFKLMNADTVLDGKSQSDDGERRTRTDWSGRIRKLMADGVAREKKEIQTALQGLYPDVAMGKIYAGINAAINSGRLREIGEGKYLNAKE